MKSLELPSGSIVLAPDQVPDSVYVLRRGYLGIFDRLERLMTVVYKEEPFGLEAIFDLKTFMYAKALIQIEVEMYDPDEFLQSLRSSSRVDLLRILSRRIQHVKRRYHLKADERMRDLIKDFKDNGLSNNEIRSMALNFSVSDALAFERVKGEFGV